MALTDDQVDMLARLMVFSLWSPVTVEPPCEHCGGLVLRIRGSLYHHCTVRCSRCGHEPCLLCGWWCDMAVKDEDGELGACPCIDSGCDFRARDGG